MPGGERCHATGRLINDKFATLIRERAARLEQHNSGWIVEPGAQRIGNALGNLRVARNPNDAPIGGECGTELRLCRMGHMNERCVALC
jgi:hypothetical protein